MGPGRLVKKNRYKRFHETVPLTLRVISKLLIDKVMSAVEGVELATSGSGGSQNHYLGGWLDRCDEGL